VGNEDEAVSTAAILNIPTGRKKRVFTSVSAATPLY
jgi:hypothetical protein